MKLAAAHAIAHHRAKLFAFSYRELHNLLNTNSDLAVSFLWSMVHTLSHRMRATNDKVTAMFALSKFQ